MRTTWLGLSAFALLWSGIALGQNAQCDRDCLRGALLRYMNAVAKNEPNDAGIIVGFRQTENAEVKRVGTGTWQSVTALGEVQRLFMDPVTGQAAYFGLVQEGATLAVASVRVKVVDGQVAEAEWYIGRPGQLGMQGDVGADGANAGPYDPPNFLANPPPRERNVPVNERLSRATLVGVANSYFDAITAHDGSIMLIQPACQRIENGRQITGRVLPEGSDDGYQGKTICSSGIRTTGRLDIAFVAHRRYPLVDEQQQVVLGMAVFLRNPNSINRRLGLSEYFYIDDGLISSVYAGMFYAPPELPLPNWPPYADNLP